MNAIPKYTLQQQRMYNNTQALKRGYILESYSLMEMRQFSTAIFEAPDDDHIGRNT
jgi:hypothetical protein